MTGVPSRPATRLYLITPPQVEEKILFRDRLLAALDRGGDVASLQIRQKDGGRINLARTEELARLLLAPLNERGIDVIINDSVELTQALGAHGVHLGWEDMSVKDARKILGPQTIVGATAKNSRHAAMQAGEDGADYIAFGAFYPTQTKANTVPAALELLEDWQEIMEIPCVAIGGITIENAEPLVRAGADYLAVTAGVFSQPDWGEAISAFNALFARLAEPG
jgi:thiamine-phosphate pyrophosphorylase